MFKAACGVLVAFILAGSASAAAPSTLGYQGRLATAGGQPVTGNLSITFRLYDVASGGSALWTETQGAVAVDGGNLAVELGSVTPLPKSIWGRQLWLGVQVAGDSEMLPRPPLTAAPFALRAASTMKNTVHVSAEGTPTENGTALLAAVTAASSATQQNPIAIELDAGTYDLGSALLDVPPFVTLSGRSQAATSITSSNPVAAVRLASNTAARDFTATGTGTPADANSFVAGVDVDTAAHDGTPRDNVRVERVTAIASGAPGAIGARWGFFVCASNSRISDVTGYGQGGQFGIGFRADCPDAAGNIIEHVVANASGSSDGVRGAYLAASGTIWRDFKAFVTVNPTAQTTFGIRVFQPTTDVTSVLSDAFVSIEGGGVPETVDAIVSAIRTDSANVDLSRVRVTIDNSRVTNAIGLQIVSNPGSHVVRVEDADVAVNGVQVPQGGFGSIDGIVAVNAAAQISRAKIVVRCLSGGTYRCNGITRSNNGSGLQAGALTLDQVDVTTGHEGAADATASAAGYAGEGSARITGSTLRVLRGPAGENESVVSANASADIRIADSTLLVESTVTPTPDCAIGGAGALELYSSHVQGQTCVSGPAAICAGVTKRGTGFLASTCP